MNWKKLVLELTVQIISGVAGALLCLYLFGII